MVDLDFKFRGGCGTGEFAEKVVATYLLCMVRAAQASPDSVGFG